MRIRLMMLIQENGRQRVEVVTLAPGSVPDPVVAELYVYSGTGGVASLHLADGRRVQVERDRVRAICGWGEG